MSEVEIYLKSGQIMRIKCENFKIEYNGFGDVTGYNCEHNKDCEEDRLVWVTISDIVAVKSTKIKE